MGKLDENRPRTEPTADKQEKPLNMKGASASLVYKAGFCFFLLTTVITTFALVRLLKSNERVMDSCTQMRINSEALIVKYDNCTAANNKYEASLTSCIDSASKLEGHLKGCIEEMKGSTAEMENSIHTTIGATNSLVDCKERMTFLSKQYRLDLIKLDDALERCTNEKADLQKKLLQPCGM